MALKTRNNRSFDISSKGLKSEWVQAKHQFDSAGKSPEDSDSVRNSLSFYLKVLENEAIQFINNANGGAKSIVAGNLVNSNGDVLRPLTSITNGTSWDWTVAGAPLDSNGRIDLNVFSPAVAFIQGTSSNTDAGTHFNIPVIDSVGNTIHLDSSSFAKSTMRRNLEDDFLFQNAVKDAVQKSLTSDSEQIFEAPNVKSRNIVVLEDVAVGRNMVVDGNFTVYGEQTILNTTDTQFRDNIIVLNIPEAGGAPTIPGTSGIEIYRGTGVDTVRMLWVEATSKFAFINSAGADLKVSMGDLTASGDFALTGNAVFASNVTLGNTSTDVITIGGTSTFNAPVIANANVTLGNASGDALAVNATSTFSAPVTANANVVFNNNTTLGNASTDALTVGATSTFNANSTFNNNVTIGNAATDVFSINATSTFNNNTTFGSSTADSMTVAATSTFNGNSTFTKNVTLGNATGDVITIGGTSTFNGPLTATSSVTLGNASGDVITVGGTSTFNANATFNNNVTLGNAAADVLSVKATSTFDAPVTFNGNITLGSAAADSLSIVATTSFVNGLTIPASKGITIDGTVLTDSKPFSIKNSAGTNILAGYLMSTSNTAGTA